MKKQPRPNTHAMMVRLELRAAPELHRKFVALADSLDMSANALFNALIRTAVADSNAVRELLASDIERQARVQADLLRRTAP
jgi:hypothetical protein